jgi:hypothetical protein
MPSYHHLFRIQIQGSQRHWIPDPQHWWFKYRTPKSGGESIFGLRNYTLKIQKKCYVSVGFFEEKNCFILTKLADLTVQRKVKGKSEELTCQRAGEGGADNPPAASRIRLLQVLPPQLQLSHVVPLP